MALAQTKLTKEEQKIKNQKAHEAKEKIHSLVVKIISWRSASQGSSSLKTNNKITPKEWQRYKEYFLGISTLESPEKVKMKLKETQEAIKQNGGFA